MNKRSGVLLIVGCVLLLAIAFLMLREPAPEAVVIEAPVEVATPVQREAEPEPEAPAPIKVEKELDLIGPAISIAASHPMIIEIVQSLSPNLVQWLVSEELLRKWVILIDQIADQVKLADFIGPSDSVAKTLKPVETAALAAEINTLITETPYYFADLCEKYVDYGFQAVTRALGHLHEAGNLWQDPVGRFCLKGSKFAAVPPKR